MEGKEISEVDQYYLIYSIGRLEKYYNSPFDLVKLWKLFGPCIERCPVVEIYKPWFSGLDLED